MGWFSKKKKKADKPTLLEVQMDQKVKKEESDAAALKQQLAEEAKAQEAKGKVDKPMAFTEAAVTSHKDGIKVVDVRKTTQSQMEQLVADHKPDAPLVLNLRDLDEETRKALDDGKLQNIMHYVGRPRKGEKANEHFGNPFTHYSGSVGTTIIVDTREHAVELYESWLILEEGAPVLLQDLKAMGLTVGGKVPPYEAILKSEAKRRLWIREQLSGGHLKGLDLVCFCSPEECHGDVLLGLANEPELLNLEVEVKEIAKEVALEEQAKGAKGAKGLDLGVPLVEVDECEDTADLTLGEELEEEVLEALDADIPIAQPHGNQPPVSEMLSTPPEKAKETYRRDDS